MSAPTDTPLPVEVRGLTVEYGSPGGYVVRPIDGLDATIRDGELALLLGPSGSGKTTLMSVLGGIRRATSGTAIVGGRDLSRASESDLVQHRRHGVGFVFQAFNLVPSLTALDNVAAPLLLSGTSRRAARDLAAGLLEQVGLSARARHRPSELSGGEQQRVAIARGLVRDPPVLLADEPTANLDHVQTEGVIGLLRGLARPGRAVVVATHDDRLLPIADTSIDLAPSLETDGLATGVVTFAPGDTVFTQGDRAGLVHQIVSGAVEIVREHPDGIHEVVATRTAGEYFGELGPMMGQRRSATAYAVAASEIEAMTLHDFRVRRRHRAAGA